MIDQEIKKYALQNAIRFKGKATTSAVVGKIVGEHAEWRDKTPELTKKIEKSISEINALSFEEQRLQLEKIAPELLIEKKQERHQQLPELTHKGKVVMRFAPSPSGPLHIGHAYVLSLNAELCKKYNGKLIIRIEDTNPENINPDSYTFIPEDAQWVTGNRVNEVFIQSDRLPIYYGYAEKLIKMGHAYMCTCDSESFKELSLKEEECPCRSLSVSEQQDRYKKLFSEYKEGDAVMRIKTDLHHKNPAMRDWPAMRIKESPHPRMKDKFRVWPLLNFAVAIDDHEMGITHAIRAKDHMDNEKRQNYVYDYFGWEHPQHLYVGRINFKDMKISSTETRKNIDAGVYSGWDDIRLPFLRALKRRGFRPEAFVKYALDVGVTQNDKLVSSEDFFKTISAFNREIIDKTSNRYFFIHDPKKIEVLNAPISEVELDLHPNERKGGRPFTISGTFYLSKKDLAHCAEGDLIRLMDLFNIQCKEDEWMFHSEEYEVYKQQGKRIIHWLPEEEVIPMTVMMPDGSSFKGVGEKNILNEKVGSLVQLERFGFCRIDTMGKEVILWYTHA